MTIWNHRQSSRFVALFVLFLMTLMQTGTDVYLPSFPAIRQQLHTTNTLVQQTFSLYLAGFAVSQLFYGPLTDRFGRKPILLIGVLVYFSMAVVSALSDSIVLLLLARLVQGLGAGAGTVVARAVVRDCFAGKAFEKMMVYLTLVWSLVPMTAPLLGSYIEHYLGWRFNFVFLAIMGFIACLLSLIFKETNLQKDSALNVREIAQAYKEMLLNKNFLFSFVCAMGVISCLAAFNVSAPLIIQDTLKFSSVEYGWSIFGIATSFMVGTVINTLLLKRYGAKTITSIGMVCITIAVLILVVFGFCRPFYLAMLLGPVALLQVGLSLVFSLNVATSMHAFAQMAGKAAALIGCGLFLGGTATTQVMSLLPADSLMPLALVLAFVVVIMWIFHRKALHFRASEMGN